jgi:tetratricopeptide (TPR) repeat protein
MKTSRIIKILILFSVALCAGGCASVLAVKSEPLQADVFLQDPVSGNKKVIGKTPIEMSTSEVKALVGEEVMSGEYFTLIVEKQGYVSEKFLIPSTRFGVLVTALDVKMKAGNNPKEEKLAKDVLNRLFLAQKLAKTREYERAQIELDKILNEFPEFPRALSMRASIYFMQKNYAESQKWYEQAINADPQMEDAVQMLAKVRALQGGGVAKTPDRQIGSVPPTAQGGKP